MASKRKPEEGKAADASKKSKTEPTFTMQKDLIALADKSVESAAIISFAEAEALWKSAQDGPGVTANEFKTLEHILNEYNFTKKARAYLDPLVMKQSSGTSLYKTVAGVKYDRSCMDLAVHLVKDGSISLGDAKLLWEDVLDGKGVTPTEKRTIDWVMEKHKLTEGAKTFLGEKIAAWDTANPNMKKVKLGDTGPEVTELCLGTMTWGRQMTNEKTAHEILDAYVAAGGNFIDTAELYPVPATAATTGKTEEYIGGWIKKNPAVRAKVIIATKVCGPVARNWVVKARVAGATEEEIKSDGPYPNLDTASIQDAAAASCRRLHTDYLDILYLHWPSRPLPVFGKSIISAESHSGKSATHPLSGDRKHEIIELEVSIAAMGELIKKGTIRHWAVSNETAFGVCEIARLCDKMNVPKPVCIQNDYSLTNRFYEVSAAEACAPWNHNISGVPYGLLNGGFLSEKYLGGAAPAGCRHVNFPDFQARYHQAGVAIAQEKYAVVAKEAGMNLATLALVWGRLQFFNQSIIIAANTLEQLKENLSTLDVIELSEKTIAAIDAIHFENKNPQLTDQTR